MSGRRHDRGVDGLRFGRQFRALRIRLRRRQSDLSEISGLSRSMIAAIDRGQLDGVTIGSLRRATAAIGADVDLWLRWRGERLDQLLDEDHAAIVEAVVKLLTRNGWIAEVEVSFNVWGERGSIDVFGFHPEFGALLSVEVKSVVPDSQATLHGLDRKTRLAPQLAETRGWNVTHVSRLLVIRDTSTSRRRISRLVTTYEVALPTRGRDVTRWIRRPERSIAGLLFLPDDSHRGTVPRPHGRERVNKPRRHLDTPDSGPDDSFPSI
jgi:transcriptional regulator with XRE-family HTH domain